MTERIYDPAGPSPGSAKRQQQLSRSGTIAQGHRPDTAADTLLDLQRSAGNRAVATLLRQSQLAVGGDSLHRAPADGQAPAHSGNPTVTEIAIDGDGDQQKELLLRITVAAAPAHSSLVGLEIVQLSSHASQRLDFTLLTPWGQTDGDLVPILSAITDGKGPTRISLVRPGLGVTGESGQVLLIYPPDSTADGRDYRVEHQADGPGKSAVLHLPKEAASSSSVAAAGAVSTVDGMGIVDDLSVVDVTLGTYGDQFRVLIQPAGPGTARLYVAALAGGEPEFGHGVQIALSGPLSMRVVDSGPVSVGLDLNGDGKAEVLLFDELDVHTPLHGAQDSAVSRFHKVRVAGTAVGTDAIFAFQVRLGELSSAVSAIGGITAIDIALGAFRDYGNRYRLTFQPTGPDTARFGISTLEHDRPAGSIGAEIALRGPLTVQLIETGPGSVGVDLDDDKKPEIVVSEAVSAETVGGDGRIARAPFQAPRYGRLRATGPALGADLSAEFTGTSDGAKDAASNAMAVDTLAKQAVEGSLQLQIDGTENAMAEIRAKAAKAGVIQPATLAAWSALSLDLIRLEPGIVRWSDIRSAMARGVEEEQRLLREHHVDDALKEKAAADATAFIQALGTEMHNPVLGTWLGSSLAHDLKAGNWNEEFRAYELGVDLLDQWIIAGLKKREEAETEARDGDVKAGSGSDVESVSERAEFLGAQKQALRDVAEHSPQRLLAVFHPDVRFETEEGFVAEIPWTLYYWKEITRTGDIQLCTWHLKDLTDPRNPHEYRLEGHLDDTEPPDDLLHKLNDPDRFPVGRIHLQIPGGRAAEIATTDHMTWKKFWTDLSLGLAVVGFVLAPELGLLEFEVASDVAFAGSALAMGVVAGTDLKEHMDQGDLDTATAVLDIAQIVSALAGVSAFGARLIYAKQLTATATRFYVAMKATRVAADVVTLASFGVETAGQLDDIEHGPGTRAEKDRAKFRLLAQFAVTGVLMASQIKFSGEKPELGAGKTVRLQLPEGGGPRIASIEGEEVAVATKSSATGDGPNAGHQEPDVGNLTVPPTGGHGAGPSPSPADPLAAEPRVRIVSMHDSPMGSAGYEGSGARVYKVPVETPTGVREAAVKLRADDQSVRHPDPDLRGRVAVEMEAARAAHATGYGPEVYGVVEVPAEPAGAGQHGSSSGGPSGQQDYADPADKTKLRVGFAMGIQEGGYYDASFSRDPIKMATNEAEAAANAARVNDRTLAEFDDYAQKLLDGGHYYKGEAQGLVGPHGEFKPIDFETIRPMPPKGTPEYDEALAAHARNMGSERSIIESILADNRARGAVVP